MKIFAILLVILAILISGCVSVVNPVNPEDVIVNPAPVTIKEFQEQDISVRVLNNATEPIDSVKVASLEGFNVTYSGNANIPARTTEGPSSVTLNAKIQAPGFKTVANTSTLALSYASGKDENGNPTIRTKTAQVQTTVLPNAKLQFVGFAKGPQNLTESALNTWEIGKGENITITFSVRNEGRTTIDENTLSVLVDFENKRIGTNKTITIREAMARGGTSYTKGATLPILPDAPNGETDVYVTLLMGGNTIDSKTIHLKVRL